MGSQAPDLDMLADAAMFRTCEQCGLCSSACPLTGVNGFNIRRILRHVELGFSVEIADSPLPWSCTTCGRCESVCPNGIAILDIIRPLRSMTPGIHAPDGPPRCVKACPAGIDIPGYLRHIAEGSPGKACEVILESTPFPGILGRVCPHPCEDRCRRGEVNQAVSICALKRYAADNAGELDGGVLAVKEDTGKRVAVVGAGPAGLAAAYFLRKKGHGITVFEAGPKAGGMMRYGIPRFRLPEAVLDEEIQQVLSLGIELKTGMKLGEDFDLNRLKEEGYDAVFVAVGLQKSKRIPLEGEALEAVLWGVDFLREVGEGKAVRVKERVVVIGGGDVAVDVALTALRLGAGEVTLACLESREEMPAHSWEIEAALEEGVALKNSWGPRRVLSDDGRVRGIELVQCTSVFDEDGNFSPVLGEGIETVPADQVILAIGQVSDLSFVQDGGAIRVEGGLMVVDADTGQTGMPGVFAGGEITAGPGALIEAIASGKQAAASIDRFLGGDGIVEDVVAARVDTRSYDGVRERGFADLERAVPPVPEHRGGFAEVQQCLKEEDAVKEARRCFQCDLERHPECLPRRVDDEAGQKKVEP